MLASRDDLNKSINVNHSAPLVIVKTNATKKTSNSIKWSGNKKSDFRTVETFCTQKKL